MAKRPTNASTKPIPNTWYVVCYYKKGDMDVHQFKKAKLADEFKKKVKARCDQVEIEHPYETGFDTGLKHGKQALKPVVKVKDTSWETDGTKLMAKKRESINPGYADEEMHRDFVAGYETGFKQAWLEKVNQSAKAKAKSTGTSQAFIIKEHYIGGGWQPAQLDENDVPITYTTRAKAEKEIEGIMADFPKDDPEDYRVFVYKPTPNKSTAASAQRQRPGMRSTISKVLKAHGESIESLKAKGAIKILNEPYMPLSLDYLGNNGKYDMFSVAHNYIQNGDVMADPDMQFVDDGTYWYPTTFQNDGIGVYKEVYEFDAKGNFSKANPRLKAELESFARTWARNIDHQGFAGGKLAARNECFKRKSKKKTKKE